MSLHCPGSTAVLPLAVQSQIKLLLTILSDRVAEHVYLRRSGRPSANEVGLKKCASTAPSERPVPLTAFTRAGSPRDPPTTAHLCCARSARREASLVPPLLPELARSGLNTTPRPASLYSLKIYLPRLLRRLVGPVGLVGRKRLAFRLRLDRDRLTTPRSAPGRRSFKKTFLFILFC